SECAGSGAEDRASTRHVIELHHALGDVERMVIGQRDNPGRQPDAFGALARGGEEHLGRRDHLPAAGVVLAAPEFIIAEFVQQLDEIEIATELQHRMFADGMVRGEEGAEAKAWHAVDTPVSGRIVRAWRGTRYSGGRSYHTRPSFKVSWASRRRLAMMVSPSLSRSSKLPSRNSNT